MEIEHFENIYDDEDELDRLSSTSVSNMPGSHQISEEDMDDHQHNLPVTEHATPNLPDNAAIFPSDTAPAAGAAVEDLESPGGEKDVPIRSIDEIREFANQKPSVEDQQHDEYDDDNDDDNDDDDEKEMLSEHDAAATAAVLGSGVGNRWLNSSLVWTVFFWLGMGMFGMLGTSIFFCILGFTHVLSNGNLIGYVTIALMAIALLVLPITCGMACLIDSKWGSATLFGRFTPRRMYRVKKEKSELQENHVEEENEHAPLNETKQAAASMSVNDIELDELQNE